MSKQNHTAAGGILSLERLVFFSDAVFAIAITLLIIEIEIPDLAHGISVQEEWKELGALWPSFLAFVLSFLVIGRFWMGHHAVFGQIERYDDRLMWPNMFFLLCIAAMPFATGLLGKNLGRFVPELIYNLMMLLCGGMSLLLSLTAHRRGLFGNAERSAAIAWRTAPVVVAAALCVALTFVAPLFSQYGMVTTPLWAWLLRSRMS